MIKPINITTENIDNQRIIYIRFRGSYVDFRKQSRKMFKELFEFATKNDLIVPDVTKVLTIYMTIHSLLMIKIFVQVSQ